MGNLVPSRHSSTQPQHTHTHSRLSMRHTHCTTLNHFQDHGMCCLCRLFVGYACMVCLWLDGSICLSGKARNIVIDIFETDLKASANNQTENRRKLGGRGKTRQKKTLSTIDKSGILSIHFTNGLFACIQS